MVARAIAGLVIALAPARAADPANAAPGVDYVGSRACYGCHTKIYRDWVRTAMGHSMAPAGAVVPLAQPVTVFSAKLDRHFEVFRRGTGLYQSEYELDVAGKEVFRSTHKLQYAVGSGVNGYTFLVRRENYLFQAPLSYYTRQGKWDLSPGYESFDYGFNRAAPPACLACHSGRARPVRAGNGLYEDPPFSELAIGCENCHGPGALHVRRRGGSGPAVRGADPTIVNPARRPPRLAEQICMYCHQGGDARVLQPGRDFLDFRPGTPLARTLVILKLPLQPGDSDLLEHHQSMALSRCYRGSGGKLGCLTCHDPHAFPQPAEAAAWYRSKCLGCHRPTSCRAPAAVRKARLDDCAGCHMPKRSVQVIAHSALTNHRIPRTPAEPLALEALAAGGAAAGGLVQLDAGSGDPPPEVLLQAYSALAPKNREFEARYLALLGELSENSVSDPFVLTALARKASEVDHNVAAAIALLRRAVERGSRLPASYQDLAGLLAQRGDSEQAIDVLLRGLALNPFDATLRKSLALRYIELRRYADAGEAMRRYVVLFPEDDFMRGLLEQAARPDKP